MSKRKKILLSLAAVLAMAALVLLVPLTARKIDITTVATEYRIGDGDYAVEHTVTVKGTDKRNLLGWGEFEGTFAVSGFPSADQEIPLVIDFPKFSGLPFVYEFESDLENAVSLDFQHISATYNWDAFAALIMQPAGFKGKDGRFLVSGSADRERAITLAQKLYAGTLWESVFQ